MTEYEHLYRVLREESERRQASDRVIMLRLKDWREMQDASHAEFWRMLQDDRQDRAALRDELRSMQERVERAVGRVDALATRLDRRPRGQASRWGGLGGAIAGIIVAIVAALAKHMGIG